MSEHEHVLYELSHANLVRETNSSWTWSRKEAIEFSQKEGPIIDAYLHECERLIGAIPGKDIQVRSDYIFDGEGGRIGTRIVMKVDDVAINFSGDDAGIIASVLNDGIEEAGRNLIKLAAYSTPEIVRFEMGDLKVADNIIVFKNEVAYRIANKIRRSGLLSKGLMLHVGVDKVIEIKPMVDKSVVTIQDNETTISAVFYQITSGFTAKITIVSSPQGGKKLGRTVDLRIHNEHKKKLCYAMGDDAVVNMVVKEDKKMSAGRESLDHYVLVRIIAVNDVDMFQLC